MTNAVKRLDDGADQRLLSSRWWCEPISDIAQLAPIQKVSAPILAAQGVSVDIKREDLLCAYLGGNKLYKLHFHLQRALALGAHTIATFGGAYSNHIYALARAGFELGVKTVGIIRGEQPPVLSPTLCDAQIMGMRLIFVSRSAYRDKHSVAAKNQWGLNVSGVYTVPEGGGDLRGALGMAEYWRCVQQNHPGYDAVVIAAGTGASLAGIMAASQAPVAVHGLLMLKGSAKLNRQYCRHVLAMAHALRCRLAPNSLTKELPKKELQAKELQAKELKRKSCRAAHPISWQLHTDLHQGGYGPAKGDNAEAILRLSASTGIPLDPVYTGKMLCGVLALAEQGTWPPGQRVLLIHSGGLQGGRSLSVPAAGEHD